MQIVIAFGLEDALNEKKLTINTSGSTIWYSYDAPIFPKDYKTYEEYEAIIIKRFNKKFYDTLAQIKSIKA